MLVGWDLHCEVVVDVAHCELVCATKIALTFADYFGVENREATDYASLNEQTQAFIRKLEMVTGVPVAYVSKAFAKDGVLEKGTWT